MHHRSEKTAIFPDTDEPEARQPFGKSATDGVA